MKKITAFILFIVLGLALSVPAVSDAKTKDPHNKVTKSAQKQYKKSMKQQKKQQKQAQKAQKRAQKDFRKQHPYGH